MAHFDIEMYSNSLSRAVEFEMVIPNDKRTDSLNGDNEDTSGKMKTIFLLHGYTGKSGRWRIESLAEKYNFAMVMPSGENSFYLDGEATGRKYCTFVGIELVDYIRRTFGIAMDPDSTFIMGLSMGGFGALHTALAFPERFGKVAAMSSALIVHEIASMQPGSGNEVANYAYYRECFGDLDQVVESKNNPETLVTDILSSGKEMPAIYMCCGTEDFLLDNNREFHDFLDKNEVQHEYHESKGSHDDVFWDEYSVKAVEWMFGDKSRP